MEGYFLSEWVEGGCLKRMSPLQKRFRSATPFPHLELKNFLKEERAKTLLLALSKEKFIPKEADLFKFKHTNDIVSSGIKELKEFRKFLLSEEFMSYMDSITGLKIKRGAIDLAGSLYEDTDYLLCHDDQLEGRKIAFLFYLSDMGAKDGGALALWNKKLKKKTLITPRFNTFTFFEVSPHSFHEVEEVLSKKQRLALGGWFHA